MMSDNKHEEDSAVESSIFESECGLKNGNWPVMAVITCTFDKADSVPLPVDGAVADDARSMMIGLITQSPAAQEDHPYCPVHTVYYD